MKTLYKIIIASTLILVLLLGAQVSNVAEQIDNLQIPAPVVPAIDLSGINTIIAENVELKEEITSLKDDLMWSRSDREYFEELSNECFEKLSDECNA